jgi:hypothetical protein
MAMDPGSCCCLFAFVAFVVDLLFILIHIPRIRLMIEMIWWHQFINPPGFRDANSPLKRQSRQHRDALPASISDAAHYQYVILG